MLQNIKNGERGEQPGQLLWILSRMGNLSRASAGFSEAPNGGESFSSLSFGSGYTEIVASGINNKLNFSRESGAAQQFQLHSGFAGTTCFCKGF